jgi:predicted permease
MELLELWRLSKKVYKEIVFQSVFSLRTSGAVPWGGDAEKSINTLVKNAETNTKVSKYMTAFFIGFIGVFIMFAGPTIEVEREMASIYSVSTILGMVLFIIAFMGIQVATSFVSSRIADLLIAFPVSRRDVSKIILMCFIRIFDIPLIASTVIIPLAYGISYNSVSGAVTTLLSIIVTEIFALTLAVFLALFFYSKVMRGGGKSKWSTFMRLIYMLVWIVPTFLAYSIMSMAPQAIILMKTLAQNASYTFSLLYPFSFGFLVSFMTFFNVSDPKILILSLGSSLIYIVLAAYFFKWLIRRIVKIGAGEILLVSRGEVKDIFISPRSPWLGILKKDLMIASRSPSYFSILAMPVIQAVIFGFSTRSIYASGEAPPVLSLFTFLPLLIMTSVMISFLPSTLLAIEGTAHSYVGSLPLKKKSLFFAKTILSLSSYLVSLFILLMIILATAPTLASIFILLGGIYIFPVFSSIVFEMMVIFKMSGGMLPSGNLYSRPISYLLPIAISSVATVIPVIAYFAIMVLTLSEVLSIIGLVTISILEFAIALMFLLRMKN